MSDTDHIPYYHSHFLNYYVRNNDTKKILDPISTIVRLALLRYKNEGVQHKTKISVDDNKVIFNEPSLWPINYQGLYRGLNGYSRQDLILIYPPVFRSMFWFNPKDTDEMLCDNIKNILSVANKGFETLREMYKEEDGRIEMFLDHCIKKVTKFIDGEFDIDPLDNQIKLDDQRYEKLFKTIRLLWSPKEIEIISDKIKEIEEHLKKHETLDCAAIHKYLNTIIDILEDKDREFKNMIVFSKISETVSS